MAIKRTVRLDEDFVNRPIDYVQSTNAVEIQIQVIGFTIPSDAVVRAYVKKPTTPKKKIAYKNCTCKNNIVMFDGGDGLLNTVGLNECQIIVTKGEIVLATFVIPIMVHENLADDPSAEGLVTGDEPEMAKVMCADALIAGTPAEATSISYTSNTYFIQGDGTATINTSLAISSLTSSRITLWVPGYTAWGSTRRDLYGSIVSNTVGFGLYTDTDTATNTGLVLRIGEQTVNGIPLQSLFTSNENAYAKPIKYELTILSKRDMIILGGGTPSSSDTGYHAMLMINDKATSGYVFNIKDIPEAALTDTTQSFTLFTTGTSTAYTDRSKHNKGTHMISKMLIENLEFTEGSATPSKITKVREYTPVITDGRAGLYDSVTKKYVYPVSGSFKYVR